jgi:hypothetical protein
MLLSSVKSDGLLEVLTFPHQNIFIASPGLRQLEAEPLRLGAFLTIDGAAWFDWSLFEPFQPNFGLRPHIFGRGAAKTRPAAHRVFDPKNRENILADFGFNCLHFG